MNERASSGDQQHGAQPPRVKAQSPALPTRQNRLCSGIVGAGSLTPYQRWIVETRIARIGAALQDLGDHVRRLRQECAGPDLGAPGFP